MLSDVLFTALLIGAGAVIATLVMYWLARGTLTFRLTQQLMPCMSVIVLAGYLWAKLGGSSNWTATLTVVLPGVCFTIGGFVYVGRTLGGKISELAQALSQGSEQVTSAANQVATASNTLATNATEQASAVEETSASSSEVNHRAHRNAEHCVSVAGMIAGSQERVATANHLLTQMTVAMAGISGSSAKISKINRVIDEIAFQTNILALNAAVEAARAGDAGLGFSVVADEVRNLAQRSAQAARETSALIEESIAKSGEGKQKVDEVAAAIRLITDDSGKITTMVQEMSSGSAGQALATKQIGAALESISGSTQQTAATAEECAAAAEELNAQAMSMADVARRLAAIAGTGVRG